MKCRIVGTVVLLVYVCPLCLGQEREGELSLSVRIESEAAYLEKLGEDLKLSLQEVRNLRDILEKAKVSLKDWEKLSAERQEEYLVLLGDYVKLQKQLKNWKIGSLCIELGALGIGLLGGLLMAH